MLIQDNSEHRRKIESAIQQQLDLEMVGQFETFERAVYGLHSHSQNEPVDIILLDLNLPEINAFNGIQILQTLSPHAAIMVLTASAREADIMHAFSLGAAGYLLESDTPNRICRAIRAVASGGMLVDPSILRLIAEMLDSPALGPRETRAQAGMVKTANLLSRRR